MQASLWAGVCDTCEVSTVVELEVAAACLSFATQLYTNGAEGWRRYVFFGLNQFDGDDWCGPTFEVCLQTNESAAVDVVQSPAG